MIDLPSVIRQQLEELVYQLAPVACSPEDNAETKAEIERLLPGCRCVDEYIDRDGWSYHLEGTPTFLDELFQAGVRHGEQAAIGLPALIDKWRLDADNTAEHKIGLSWAHGHRLALRYCADELAAVLRASASNNEKEST